VESEASAVIQARGLSVHYDGIRAVDRVDLEVRQGETVVLAGANGAGKSSIINSIMGLTPCSGELAYCGTRIERDSVGRRARSGIRLSPEGRRLFAKLSVYDNVVSGAFTLSRRERAVAMDWALSTFDLVAARRDQLAGTLSGGQQQIVALARALVSRPKLLLLDEPFLGLSPIAITETSAAIRVAQEAGSAVLISEQMARPALALADRAYVLRAGKVIRAGTAQDIADAALSEEYL
jgi:branched-chain amino acid transport system ATP-binding protein